MPANEMEGLIRLLSRLPGLGPRSARRAVLHLIKQREGLMLPLAAAMQRTAEAMKTCGLCGNIDTADPCSICTDPKRDPLSLCVVEEVGDLWALERSGAFKGLYHVLGGTLSAIDGRGPGQLNMETLFDKAGKGRIREVILALSATVEGQTTAHYLSERLASSEVQVTRLAQGLPVGGELDYLDDGTLTAALKARRPF
ncbi:MAG: recombination mediator RecR [Kiloniellales bacterium]|nr:recombination mediator RecR [Kiloniellales bacterium]